MVGSLERSQGRWSKSHVRGGREPFNPFYRISHAPWNGSAAHSPTWQRSFNRSSPPSVRRQSFLFLSFEAFFALSAPYVIVSLSVST